MNGSTVEKVEKKDEKRRALGRGLASLLPGPRVVPATAPSAAVPVVTSDGPIVAKDAAPTAAVPEAAAESSVVETGRAGVPAPHNLTPHHSASSAPPVLLDASSGEEISLQAVADSKSADAPKVGTSVAMVGVDQIDKNPYQTRYVFDPEMLQELAESIKQNGVVQPIVVRPAAQGRYTLVLGERRLRASKLAGKETIPAIVRRLSPQQAAEMTVLENLQRQDLNPVEQAEAFRVLSTQFALTQGQIAERVGVSRETVANYMRLLRLPEEVMQCVAEGQLTFSIARELLTLENPEHIEKLAEEAATKQLSLEQVEDKVRALNGFFSGPENPVEEAEKVERRRRARWQDPNVRAAQTDMEHTLGMRVRIRDRNGKGSILIEYATVDDYQRLGELLRGKRK